MEGMRKDRIGTDGIGRAFLQASTVEGTGEEWIGLDRNGMESSGWDWTGMAFFHASTVEWSGAERTGEERKGSDRIGVFFKPRENER
jgi:hypothetical protein